MKLVLLLMTIFTTTNAYSQHIDNIELEFNSFVADFSHPVSIDEILNEMPDYLSDLDWRVEVVDEIDHVYELQLLSFHYLKDNLFWEFSYLMRGKKNVEFFDPVFVPSIGDREYRKLEKRINSFGGSVDPSNGVPGDGLFNECSWSEQQRSNFLFNGERLCYPASSDRFDWANEVLRYKQAWEFSPARGEGIIIGHPDSGYTYHPEIIENVLPLGRDFVDKDADPADSYEGNTHGHGTSTASLMVSPSGMQEYQLSERHISIFGEDLEQAPFVDGIAPEAKILPYRVTNGSVVMFSFIKLTMAINNAIRDGVDVLSISLGGPLPMPWLHRAIKKANEAGIIVIAASGNYIPETLFKKFVVWPAHYNETVAVAASDPDNLVWQYSSKGKRIDTTAPGAGVWVARSRERNGKRVTEVTRGAGTSYSTAYLAGAAALFLSHHGKENLENLYGSHNLNRLFKYMLKHHAYRRPAGWDNDNYGPGILDIEKLMKAELPSYSEIAPTVNDFNSEDLDHMALLFPKMSKRVFIREIRRAFRLRSDVELYAKMQDIGHELKLYFSKDKRLRDYFYFAVTSDFKMKWKRINRFKRMLRKVQPSQDLVDKLNL